MTVDSRPPPQLLADRSWRMRNSAWMLPVILGCGMATWASFLYIGIKARRRSWQIAAGVYSVAFVAMMVVSGSAEGDPQHGSTGTASNLMGGLLVATWAAGIVHAVMVRPQWLRWRADHNQPWWATPTHPAPAPAPQMHPPAASIPAPVAPLVEPSRFWAPPAPAAALGQVTIAVATPAELAALGIDPAGVQRLLAARSRPGGITTVQDFADLAGLPPHRLAAVVQRVVLSAPPSPAPGRPTFPAPGRRLEL